MKAKEWAEFLEMNSMLLGDSDIRDETAADREFRDLIDDYLQATGEPMPRSVPLDYGYRIISDDDLMKYAKAAIAAGKPIDWREIYGIPVCELNPEIVT